MLKAVGQGHKVHFLTCTNGDKYGKIPEGASLQEVRECEAKAACAACGAEVHFLRYRDQELPFNEDTLSLTREYIVRLQADLVLAHWPADHHRDHQIAGVLATQAVMPLPDVGLVYYEATIGGQTFGMTPNRYVDISDVVEKKRELIRCFVSQGPENIIGLKDLMERWHGANMRVPYAEAYCMHKTTRSGEELFLPK